MLQKICNLPKTFKGWFTFLEGTDNSSGADVVRIRHYRNTIYGHNESMEIANADFKKLWKEILEPHTVHDDLSINLPFLDVSYFSFELLVRFLHFTQEVVIY